MFEISLDEIFQMNQRKIDSQIQFKRTLARGAFGTVVLAYDKSKHQEVAVKIIQKDNERQSIIRHFKEEINVLKKANHSNIVNLYDFFETKDNVYIVMEYIKGGTLKELMQLRKNILSDNEVRKIITYLLKAVDHLHKLGICHRDIKPENIMFNSFEDLSSLKLIDFGLSTELLTNSLLFCGTVLFMSPERLMKKTYSNEIDVWSIGIITYMLLHQGKHPFHTTQENVNSYLQVVLSTSIESRIAPSISFLAKNLIKKLVEVKPSNRYSASFALHHPWISQDYSRIHNHLLQEEVEEFKAKQRNAFISVLFLSQYAKMAPKEEEDQSLETDNNSTSSKSSLLLKTEGNMRKTKSNSFFNKKVGREEPILVSKKKTNAHLSIFSQSTFRTKHPPSEHDSQSSFSSKELNGFVSETQSNESSAEKLRVIKATEAKPPRRSSLIGSTHSTFLSSMFSKNRKSQNSKGVHSKMSTISSYHSYTKTSANFSNELAIPKKKAKDRFIVVLPAINK